MWMRIFFQINVDADYGGMNIVCVCRKRQNLEVHFEPPARFVTARDESPRHVCNTRRNAKQDVEKIVKVINGMRIEIARETERGRGEGEEEEVIRPRLKRDKICPALDKYRPTLVLLLSSIYTLHPQKKHPAHTPGSTPARLCAHRVPFLYENGILFLLFYIYFQPTFPLPARQAWGG